MSCAKVAAACGFEGVAASTPAELTEAVRKSCEDRKRGVTTFIEAVLNQALGEPFRCDAMKKPVVVADVDRADMRTMRPRKRSVFTSARNASNIARLAANCRVAAALDVTEAFQ